MESLTDRRIEALATRLENYVTRRALSRMIATNAVVAGLASGESPAAVEADLLAQVKRYEILQALRQSREAAEQIIQDLRAQGLSEADDRLMLEIISTVTHSLIQHARSERDDI